MGLSRSKDRHFAPKRPKAQDPGLRGHAAALEPAERPLEERILGYWMPDWEAISVNENWIAMVKGMAELSLGDRTEEGVAQSEKKVMEEFAGAA